MQLLEKRIKELLLFWFELTMDPNMGIWATVAQVEYEKLMDWLEGNGKLSDQEIVNLYMTMQTQHAMISEIEFLSLEELAGIATD